MYVQGNVRRGESAAGGGLCVWGGLDNVQVNGKKSLGRR